MGDVQPPPDRSPGRYRTASRRSNTPQAPDPLSDRIRLFHRNRRRRLQFRQRLSRPNNPNRLKIELYDLQKDIAESNDVAGKNPKVVARIRDLMNREHRPSAIFPIKALDATVRQ